MRSVRPLAVLLVVAMCIGACGRGEDGKGRGVESVRSAAADHRVRIEVLLREHVFLMGSVTQAVATARIAEYEGAASALDDNGVAIALQLRGQYGEMAERRFLALWRPYLKAIPAYAARLSRKKPAADLLKQITGFPKKLGDLMSSITPLLNPFRTTNQMKSVVSTMKSVIASQVKKDFTKADSTLRSAGGQAGALGADIAQAMIDDHPENLEGIADTTAAAFRYTLNSILAENVLLLSLATQGTVTRRSSEAKGATAAVKANVGQLASHLGSAYGSAFQTSFLSSWQRLDDLVVSYAGAGKDKAKKTKAAADVKGQAKAVTAVLAGANKRMDKEELELFVGQLVDACLSVVDAQGAGDFAKAGGTIRTAVQDIERIAGLLAQETVLRFPSKFQPKVR